MKIKDIRDLEIPFEVSRENSLPKVNIEHENIVFKFF